LIIKFNAKNQTRQGLEGDAKVSRQFRTPWAELTTLFMHQCPNPRVSDWKWGDTIYNMITNKLIEAKFLKPGFKY